MNIESVGLQYSGISRRCGGNFFLNIVEDINILGEPRRFLRLVQNNSTSNVAVGVPIFCQEEKNISLKLC